jgi:oligopeptidase B
VLVDLNELGKGEKFIGIGSYDVSNDGNLLAYSIDKTGHRDYELFVKDLRTGSLVPQKVGTVSSVAWAADNATLFFTQEDPVSKRSYKLGRCELGTGKIDILYEEKDENLRCRARRLARPQVPVLRVREQAHLGGAGAARRYAARGMEGPGSPQGRPQVLGRPPGGPLLLRHEQGREELQGRYCPVATPDEAHWTDFVPADPDVKVDDITLFAKYAVVSERKGGLPRLRVIDLATHAATEIPFPEPSYEAEMAANAEYDTTVVRFSYQSPVTAPSVFAYDMATRAPGRL